MKKGGMTMLTLAQWRRLKDISQEEMAKACDVHVNTYRRWEEKPSIIKVTYVDKLAEKLGVSVSDILFST